MVKKSPAPLSAAAGCLALCSAPAMSLWLDAYGTNDFYNVKYSQFPQSQGTGTRPALASDTALSVCDMRHNCPPRGARH